jgi:hypothetical protein
MLLWRGGAVSSVLASEGIFCCLSDRRSGEGLVESEAERDLMMRIIKEKHMSGSQMKRAREKKALLTYAVGSVGSSASSPVRTNDG